MTIKTLNGGVIKKSKCYSVVEHFKYIRDNYIFGRKHIFMCAFKKKSSKEKINNVSCRISIYIY